MSGIAVGDDAAMTWNLACGAWDFGSGCYCHNRIKRPASKNIEAPTFLTRTRIP
jgi:hypothetical protein